MASVPVLDLQSLAEMADDLAAHRAFPDRVEPCLVPQGRHEDLQALPEGVSPEIIEAGLRARFVQQGPLPRRRLTPVHSTTPCAKPVKATRSGVKKPSTAGGGGLRAT